MGDPARWSVAEREPRHVALLIETSNAYARQLLVGIKTYLTRHPGWSIYLGEHGRYETDLSWLDGWRGDGVIARIENERTAARVRQLGVPAVDLSAARLVPELPCVETDDDMIARLAVDHFSVRGIRNLAYCGDSRFAWSVTRGLRFAEHVAERGAEPLEFAMQSSGTLAEDRYLMAGWLRDLPKPVGILACYDIAAQELLEACRIAGVDVPGAVAVLGVDDDELICSLTSPSLSSIRTDAPSTGYLAATLLDRMMSGARLEPELHLIPPLRVVARESSDVFAVSDALVARALRLIRDRADSGVSVAELEHHVGLSRRALDMRFSRAIGRTAHEEITRVRMERVADLLVTTDWPLPRIAERLCFSHPEYMGVAFKRFWGRSPGDYRRSNRVDLLRYA